MYAIVCIELNIVAVALCLMVYFHQSPKDKVEFFDTHHFNRILWMTVVILLLNICAWIVEGALPEKCAFLHMLIMTAFFLSQTVLAMELSKYCMSICEYDSPGWLKRLTWLPVGINAVQLLINHIHPFAYNVVGNAYERLPFFFLIVVWPLIYIIASVIICVVRCCTTTSYKRDTALKLLIFTMIILISSAMSAVIYGFTPWPIIALGLMFLYMNVHNRRAKALGMLAYRDALTGVQNATAHSFRMQELDKRIQAGSASFAIIVADVNDLKLVNDCYGHRAGDQLLISTARLLCDIFAHSPVQRIGGDEFTIILEGSDFQNRDLLIRRLQRELVYATFNAGNMQRNISIAIGMAEYDPRLHRSSADVFQAADRSMYVHKDNLKLRKP